VPDRREAENGEERRIRVDGGGGGGEANGDGRGAAIGFLMQWLEAQPLSKTLGGVGHRIVHGMHHTEPERVSTALLDEIKGFVAFDPSTCRARSN